MTHKVSKLAWPHKLHYMYLKFAEVCFITYEVNFCLWDEDYVIASFKCYVAALSVMILRNLSQKMTWPHTVGWLVILTCLNDSTGWGKVDTPRKDMHIIFSKNTSWNVQNMTSSLTATGMLLDKLATLRLTLIIYITFICITSESNDNTGILGKCILLWYHAFSLFLVIDHHCSLFHRKKAGCGLLV